ncbi:hypothetical protein BDF20DRAFT_911889 [Mycotypha africana]|uniref:uncharacterized protein n=1 Tax=Mycotypha africana TaxID=64632 RepID=UPI00230151C5|nr:uncharacterized protein BDF20DRAFT_911889 [Mycotypha africana]KAI8981616.1 hypothetical protein BDF20DRAFT_911889 [Mycotypha africana]
MVSATASRKSAVVANGSNNNITPSQNVPTVVPASPEHESTASQPTSFSAATPTNNGTPLKMRNYRPITPNPPTDSPTQLQAQQNQAQQQSSRQQQSQQQFSSAHSGVSTPQQQGQPNSTAQQQKPQQDPKVSQPSEQHQTTLPQVTKSLPPQQQQPQIQIIEFHPPTGSSNNLTHQPPSILQRQQQQQHQSNYTNSEAQPPSHVPAPLHTRSPPQQTPQKTPQQQQQQQRLQARFTTPFTFQEKLQFLETYWPESKVALLIQLHRKHYNGLSSEDEDKSLAAWVALTNEYNSITNDQRSRSSIMYKWERLMAKYNAERVFVQMQQPTSSLPAVSFWNHFQYMDEYLHHLPIVTEPLIYSHLENANSNNSNNSGNGGHENYRKRRSVYLFDDDVNDEELDHNLLKRRKSTAARVTTPALSPSSAHIGNNMSTSSALIVDSQRMFMEQLKEMNKAQVQMMKDFNEYMQKSQLKMMSMCGGITEKNKVMEEKYVRLLEILSRNIAATTVDNSTSSDTIANDINDLTATENDTHNNASIKQNNDEIIGTSSAADCSVE